RQGESISPAGKLLVHRHVPPAPSGTGRLAFRAGFRLAGLSSQAGGSAGSAQPFPEARRTIRGQPVPGKLPRQTAVSGTTVCLLSGATTGSAPGCLRGRAVV